MLHLLDCVAEHCLNVVHREHRTELRNQGCSVSERNNQMRERENESSMMLLHFGKEHRRDTERREHQCHYIPARLRIVSVL